MHLEAVGVSGANQYSVKPLALVSTVTPPTLAVFSVTAPWPAAGGGPLALATATPSRARASTDTAPTAPISTDTAECTRATLRAAELIHPSASRAGPAAAAARASVAKAATSISPAAIPALVRTSLKPNSPTHTASR